MWIKMDIKESLIMMGTMLLFVCVIPVVLGIVLGLVYRLYIRFRPKPAAPQETSATPTPLSPGRAAAYFIGMSLLLVPWSLVVGLLFGTAAQVIPILFAGAALIAFVNARMIASAVRRARIQREWQIVVLSLISSLTLYFTYHLCGYVFFQLSGFGEVATEMPGASADETLAVSAAVLDYGLREETGFTGFRGYMVYTLHQGMSVGRMFRTSRTEIGPVLTLLYWIAEFGLILAAGILWARYTPKRKPGPARCPSCRNSTDRERHLGGTSLDNEAAVLALVQQKNFAGLAKLLEPNADVPSVEVYVQGCGCSVSESRLVVRQAVIGQWGGLSIQDASHVYLHPEDRFQLQQLAGTAGD